jgi:replicative DNA helicase
MTLNFQEVPADLAAEGHLLGACIEDESILNAALENGMDEDCFSVSDHSRIFDALRAMHSASIPVDLISVVDHLQTPDSAALIADLTYGAVLHVGHSLHHLKILKRCSEQRKLLKLSEWMGDRAREFVDPAQVKNHVLDSLRDETRLVKEALR